MKPGPRDRRHLIRISGAELSELKRHTYLMCEAFGLDRRIEKYAGTRPLTLYRWDLECLLDVLHIALADEREYPDRNADSYVALDRLRGRLAQEYEDAYEDA